MIQALLHFLIAFLPVNWNAAHAKDDKAKSDFIIIGRCVGIECKDCQMEFLGVNGQKRSDVTRSYFAKIRVGKCEKGEIPKNSEVVLFIGYGQNSGEGDNFKPQDTPDHLRMCNTQTGYNISVNQLYKLYLVKSNDGIDLRSGPFSLGWLKTNGNIQFGELHGQWQPEIPLE